MNEILTRIISHEVFKAYKKTLTKSTREVFKKKFSKEIIDSYTATFRHPCNELIIFYSLNKDMYDKGFYEKIDENLFNDLVNIRLHIHLCERCKKVLKDSKDDEVE